MKGAAVAWGGSLNLNVDVHRELVFKLAQEDDVAK